MASIEGKLLICSRCSKSVFLKHIGTKEYDGGFTQVKEYEPNPEGWENVCIEHYVDLCPKCSELWAKTRSEFFALKGSGADDR